MSAGSDHHFQARSGGIDEFGNVGRLNVAGFRQRSVQLPGIHQQSAYAQRVAGRLVASAEHFLVDLTAPHQRSPFSIGAVTGCNKHLPRDPPVQGIVMAHRRHQRTIQINTHLPEHPRRALGRLAHESVEGRKRELDRPLVITHLARSFGHPLQRVHPAGQVMEILAVAIPLPTFVERFARFALRQLLAYAQTRPGRRARMLVIVHPAKPAATGVVFGIGTKHLVDLFNQSAGPVEKDIVSVCATQRQVVADSKGVGPQVSARDTVPIQPRPAGKTFH